MTAALITVGTNNTFKEEETGLIAVSTGGLSSMMDAFKSDSNRYVASNIVGRYMLVAAALSAAGAFFFGTRKGAEIERKGGKLPFESRKSYESRLALTNRTLPSNK